MQSENKCQSIWNKTERDHPEEISFTTLKKQLSWVQQLRSSLIAENILLKQGVQLMETLKGKHGFARRPPTPRLTNRRVDFVQKVGRIYSF